MSEVLSYNEFMEAMDAVNPKAVKKKFKDRKDKDIDNDGDVDASDKYLHKRRKAVSKAVSKEDIDKPMTSADRAKAMQKKANQVKRDAEAKLKKAKGLQHGKRVGLTMSEVSVGYKVKKGKKTDEPIDENTGVANKAKKSGIPKGILMQVYRRGMAAYGTGHRPGASQAQWAMARVNSFIGKGKGTWGGADKDLAAKARESMKKESLDEAMPASFQAMLVLRDKMKKAGQNTDAISAKIKKARADAMRMAPNAFNKESLDEKGPGLYANINAKRKRGEKMRKKGEKGAPSAQDFKNAAKTAREERELCHSKDHDCATVVEHIVWGLGKPMYESHAIPTDDGYVAWYDIEFEHGIEREVPTEDLKIYTTEAHGATTLNKGKKPPKSKSKAEPVKEISMKKVKKSLMKKDNEMDEEKYSDSEIKRAVEIAKKMAGSNYTGAHNAIEKMKKGLASVGKVRYALKKAAESFETWQGLSISEVNDVLVDMVASAQDYIKLVEDGDLKSVDEPEVEIAKGMPLSFKQFQSKIGD